VARQVADALSGRRRVGGRLRPGWSAGAGPGGSNGPGATRDLGGGPEHGATMPGASAAT